MKWEGYNSHFVAGACGAPAGLSSQPLDLLIILVQRFEKRHQRGGVARRQRNPLKL